jgi:hypothetical protein
VVRLALPQHRRTHRGRWLDLWDEKCAQRFHLLLKHLAHNRMQKNKSAKVQKQVATIQAQQANAGKSRATLEKEKEKALREKEKFEAEKRAKQEAEMFKPVQTQKVPPGVDPKTVLCVFFKAGHCEKGNKCKFSHNRDVERKVEKRSVYDDPSKDDKENGEC